MTDLDQVIKDADSKIGKYSHVNEVLRIVANDLKVSSYSEITDEDVIALVAIVTVVIILNTIVVIRLRPRK